jgi:transcriptional regulator with XRE-family HTH domain
MKNLNELLQELGISKVKLAKYLGVSRQMIYNYLELESLNKWPKEKKILLFKLLNIEDGSDEAISKIKVTAEYLEDIEARLNQNIKSNDGEGYFDLKNLNKDEQSLVNDLIYLIKEKFTEEKNKDTYFEFLYLYHVLQSIDNVPEIKYIFAYLSKTTGFTDPMEFKFDETAQFILESIVFTAMNLYNNGGATKSKLVASHERFVKEIENTKEEVLSRTQQLTTVKIQALRELGYNEINTENAQEVFNKMGEIQSRKVVMGERKDIPKAA